VAAEQAEQARLEAEQAEQARLAAEQAEQARLAAEQADQARLAAEQAEQARLAAERAEQERLQSEQAEQARPHAEQIQGTEASPIDTSNTDFGGGEYSQRLKKVYEFAIQMKEESIRRTRELDEQMAARKASTQEL
jgi:fused signal recognition particle receptor